MQAEELVSTSEDPGSVEDPRAGIWLIIGHGSVGYVLAGRVLAAGGRVLVRDDAPRIAPTSHKHVRSVGSDETVTATHVALCVPSSVAIAAATYLRDNVTGRPMVLDWASAPPNAKVATAGADPHNWIDVALLDSLDRVVDKPLLAVSGARSSEAAAALEVLGFAIDIAGGSVGQAAAVKLTRSLFMKPLEALVMEFRANAKVLDPSDVAWRSIAQNLGADFADFADVLVTSDVTHSGRRVPELRHAATYAGEQDCATPVADAAAELMTRLADHWADSATAPADSVDDILLAARPAFQR